MNGVMHIGLADFNRLHPAFAGQETRKGHFHLAVRQEKDRFAAQSFGRFGDSRAGAGAWSGRHTRKSRITYPKLRRDSGQPRSRALLTIRERRFKVPSMAAQQGRVGFPEERLRQRKDGIWSDRQLLSSGPGRQAAYCLDAQSSEQRQHLVFHNIGQRTHDDQLPRVRFR